LLPAAVLFLEKALEVARKAVAKEYDFHGLVASGKGEDVKKLVKAALHDDVLDHACIKEVLVVIFFEESRSWGRYLGHLFENKFPLQVLALAVALVSSRKYLIRNNISIEIFMVFATRPGWLWRNG
jgi:hypothetical protein